MSGRNDRPKGHWIKRPPRPSRAGAAPPPREKPGFGAAALAVGAGLLVGLLGASLAAQSGAPQGVPGLNGTDGAVGPQGPGGWTRATRSAPSPS